MYKAQNVDIFIKTQNDIFIKRDSANLECLKKCRHFHKSPIREGKQGTGSTLYGIVTGMKSDMSGASEQPRILEEKVETEEAEEVTEVGEPKEEPEEVQEEVLEVEKVWIHPKDRPTLTKEERKANQKLVKEQQVQTLYYKVAYAMIKGGSTLD